MRGDDGYVLGFQGYQPQFLNDVAEARRICGTLLRSLVGQRITGLWNVWSLQYNEPWFDAPVIVGTDQLQLELCAWKFDKFSVTSNTIKMAEPLCWFGDRRFELRPFPEHQEFVVEEVRFVEIRQLLDDHEWWAFGGIALAGHGRYLSVTNGMDENRLETREPESKLVRLSDV